MAKVKIFPGISQVADWLDLRRFSSMVIDAIVGEVNGRIDFVDNIRASGPHAAIFLSSSSVATITHNLNRVPSGFLVINLNTGISVFKPASPEWSDTKIYLQASGAGTASVYVLP